MDGRKCIAISLVIAVMTTGCSAFRSSTQTISVMTDQVDTEIYVNGALAGHGNASATVKRNQNVQILAKKEGYIPVNRSIGKSLNTTGVLDIVGGVLILLPIFGLLAPGAYSLDEENISIMMVKA